MCSIGNVLVKRLYCICSRIMDTKWGGKTESVQMTLNVEQVLYNMVCVFKCVIVPCIVTLG